MSEEPQPARQVTDAFGLRVIRFLGGGHHQNWLCLRDGDNVVLRRYVRPPLGDISYEHAVAARLDAEGWAVPVLLDATVRADGSTWGVFRWLPGASRDTSETIEECRERGRLLAQFHETAAKLLDLGQRPGCTEANDVIADPRLDGALSAYAAWFPREAHVMAWHLERTRAALGALDLRDAPRVVLHGDFTPWNLLYDSEVLTGVLDLEATHVNFRVADFAGAWRGEADELVYAYDAERALDELEWSLLTPVYWCWLFLGVANQIHAMIDGAAEPRLLRWPVTQLVKRTPLMRELQAPYPG